MRNRRNNDSDPQEKKESEKGNVKNKLKQIKRDSVKKSQVDVQFS